MGRFREELDADEEGGIDMSPLIDCVFILLIFFIVTTVFVEETGIDVDKPQAASAAQLEKNSILIAISAEGDVIYGDKNIGVGGVQRIVKQLTQREMLPVIIQGDENARSGIMVKVIGEAKLAGAETVSIATRS